MAKKENPITEIEVLVILRLHPRGAVFRHPEAINLLTDMAHRGLVHDVYEMGGGEVRAVATTKGLLLVDQE